MARFNLSAAQNNYVPGPFMMPDVWQEEMDPMPQEYYDNRYELNNLMSDVYSRRYADGPSMSSLSQPMQGFGNTMYGAANSAGRMMNTAMGGGISDLDNLKGKWNVQPGYQTRSYQSNLPADLQASMQQWRDYNAIGTDASKRSAYFGQYGQMPDISKVMNWMSAVPQQFQSAMEDWGKQSLNATRDMRLRVDPNDVIGNAMLSNKHITNQGYNQPGAQFKIPDGNQRGNMLRRFGSAVNLDAGLADWADTADALADEILPSGKWGAGISPSYKSMGMGNGAFGSPDVVYTGKGPTGAQWGQPNSGLSTPVNDFRPRNNNDPQYFPEAKGAGGNRMGPTKPLNGAQPIVAQGSGMPRSSGWDATRSHFDRTVEGAKGQTSPGDNSWMRRNDLYYGKGSDGSIAGQRQVNRDTLNSWNAPDRGNMLTRLGQGLSNGVNRLTGGMFGQPYVGTSSQSQPMAYQSPFSTQNNSQLYGPFAWQAPSAPGPGNYRMQQSGWIGL